MRSFCMLQRKSILTLVSFDIIRNLLSLTAGLSVLVYLICVCMIIELLLGLYAPYATYVRQFMSSLL